MWRFLQSWYGGRGKYYKQKTGFTGEGTYLRHLVIIVWNNDAYLFCRLGQKSKTVRIIYILCEGTSDQIVWDLIQKKHRVLASTVGKSNHIIVI